MSNFLKLIKKSNPFGLKKEEFTDKIGLVLIGISLVIIFLIILLFVIFTQQKRLKQLNSDGWTLTNMVAGYSLTGLERDEANKLLKIINYTGGNSGLVYGMIMDTKQRVIAHTDIFYVDKTLNDPIALRVASSNNPLKQNYEDPGTGNTIYEFSRPIYHNDKKEGAVRLGFSPDMIPLFSDNEIKGLLLVATLVFSLVPIFYYLMRKSLDSLMSLDNELKYFLETKGFKKIQANSSGWGGKLVARFNQVISDLKSKNEKLIASYEEFEVAHRVLSFEKERIASIIDSINDGIVVTDSVGNIILVNRSMACLMTFSGNDVIGKTIRECFDDEEILSFIEKNQLNGGAFAQKNLEVALNKPGGENIVIISYLPLLSSEESVLGNIIIARDITSERMAQQNQSDFIAHVAHELRTPLTTIKSYVEMLMDDEVNSRETQIDFYNTINEEANRLARLIGNLLNITKIEMGSLTIKKDLIKSREFFQDIVKSIESQALIKNIRLESIIPDKLSSLVMEKDLLRIAVLNILGNAIKYTPDDGSVTFRIEEDEHSIKAEIIDTGYGISEEDLPRIFDKFFRSSDEKVKSHTGNGLGLALSREIIRLHDGKIDVHSIIGQGSHFTIILPREESPRIRSYSGSYNSLVDN
jgi:two-component system phosphate regulon sensor histidine kinase PhoR